MAVFVLGDVRMRSHSKILSNVILGMGRLKWLLVDCLLVKCMRGLAMAGLWEATVPCL